MSELEKYTNHLKEEYSFLGELEDLKSVAQVRRMVASRQRKILEILGIQKPKVEEFQEVKRYQTGNVIQVKKDNS